MIQNHLLNKAIEIAVQAHENQVDKAQQPYINHPMRVMNACNTLPEKIVAVLHDVIEDSDLTLESLKKLGFPPLIIEALDAITKRDNEIYEVYLQRVISNPISLQVKIADMKDNMDITRITEPTEKDYQRLEKYQKTLPYLLQALEQIND